MPNNHYHHLVFGDDALARQRDNGSYVAYGAQMERGDDGPQELSDRELLMISRADQFCLATVTPNGWPYLQYRSGPAGFVHHDPASGKLRFVDLPGNNQFVTLGNLAADDRLAMFFVDYPRRIRLKVFGRGTVLQRGEARAIEITVEAFDWNCSRSIIPRYDRAYLKELSLAHQKAADEREAGLHAEIARLRARVAELEAGK
ncbi:Pyridoxamine 5'-phosphate oxidase-related FMN-binding protein OS=Tsukamurella paurometabola (strain ATCC 8368 / DSM / CCUG 35730 / CIP 100753 / JCM 10117/ KCTC 9821 / NBRC 16120 / NCIMB 702349 / NCTC 13040) OX=521096 GN=Tpau_3356 PE=4 SV=1 [Tsukamurella paurometabola]|uniref:Pyridoxamine 5'-phosphate oxidase-related FMN-binding protein n=1 Tax=Tsukamurella paurometabola (strain ATCC 8368 / DSM 20162 / CCUG 35730 / CIP 100753 / JCM 10117 / KCTC 9821 / NBRC 16120 / NCIMB 702349 / NCTC 13040) TaxID=521096 RepID=D5UWE1_TSUPD|nr:pyridoxamine 5'-phosphate oxidase family protein [Tsukamurella paurometabola]ADG79940.1 pyridoxamine 5'-phosphate oxidase-related FMN- binding protein [Tsukamurella paurometabola DSM 20162]SUP37738.1 pyridoxamine 5'-phosphate oxidase, FMN-binding family [Tsukamurella paurometabola]